LSHYTSRRRLGERRYSSYSFSTSVLDGGEWSASRSIRALAPEIGPPESHTHCTRGSVGPKAGLHREARGKILSPLQGIEPRSPGRPARSQTLYWLSYQAHHNVKHNLIYNYFDCNTKLSHRIFSGPKAGSKLFCGTTKRVAWRLMLLAPSSVIDFLKIVYLAYLLWGKLTTWFQCKATLSTFVYWNNLLINKYKIILTQCIRHLCHFITFFMGVQVISRAEAHGYRVVTFVPYSNVENLATLAATWMKCICFLPTSLNNIRQFKTPFTTELRYKCDKQQIWNVENLDGFGFH
jgi:hypothetical protein